jgi:alkylation response protein AidB-like acyl-CoA dehydrogenase
MTMGKGGGLGLSAENEAFRAEFRDWLADHLVGEYRAAGAIGSPADDSMWDLRLAWERELAQGRWLNVTWPRQYGGRGGTTTQELIFHLEHAAAGAPYWVGVQGRDLFGPTLLEFGTEAQKRRFLPAILRSQEMWGQGFSEPDAGSDLASLKTRAERVGDEWVITGQKTWTSFAARADWLYVLCRTSPDAARHRGISMLLVPVDQPGVIVAPIRNIAGGGEFCEVFLEGARTAADLVVGGVDGGWAVVMGTLGNERAGVTVLPFQARFEREMAQLLALVGSGARAKDPLQRQRVTEAWIGLRIMKLNNDRLLTAVSEGRHPGPESSVGKLFWANWHRDFGELMVECLGGAALTPESGAVGQTMVRSFLSARAETIYGGANEIQRNILGERVLGLPR